MPGSGSGKAICSCFLDNWGVVSWVVVFLKARWMRRGLPCLAYMGIWQTSFGSSLMLFGASRHSRFGWGEGFKRSITGFCTLLRLGLTVLFSCLLTCSLICGLTAGFSALEVHLRNSSGCIDASRLCLGPSSVECFIYLFKCFTSSNASSTRLDASPLSMLHLPAQMLHIEPQKLHPCI